MRALVDARAAQAEALLLELRGLEQKREALRLVAACFEKAGQPCFPEELRKLKLGVALADQLFEVFAACEVELSGHEELLESLPFV